MGDPEKPQKWQIKMVNHKASTPMQPWGKPLSAEPRGTTEMVE